MVVGSECFCSFGAVMELRSARTSSRASGAGPELGAEEVAPTARPPHPRGRVAASASWLGPHAAVLSREQTATQPSAKTQPMAKNLSLHYVPSFYCLETRDKGSDDLPQVMTQIILIICKVWVVSWDRGYRKFSFFLRSLGWRHIE